MSYLTVMIRPSYCTPFSRCRRVGGHWRLPYSCLRNLPARLLGWRTYVREHGAQAHAPVSGWPGGCCKQQRCHSPHAGAQSRHRPPPHSVAATRPKLNTLTWMAFTASCEEAYCTTPQPLDVPSGFIITSACTTLPACLRQHSARGGSTTLAGQWYKMDDQ